MTPAERVADYREELELATLHRIKAIAFRLRLEDIAKILALAEAVPAALEGKTDALAAAWVALGDEDHGS